MVLVAAQPGTGDQRAGTKMEGATMRRVAFLLAAATLMCLSAGNLSAYFPLGGALVAEYPTATNLDTCGTCHTSFTSALGLNPYGEAFLAADGLADPASAFVAIEESDSDGDGTSNGAEILTGAGFFPGWTCETYIDALNAPVDLVDFVDPIDPGCTGVTTTSTTTVTTATSTTTLTTSTTLSDVRCAQPVSSGPTPVSTDCLYILQASIGLQTCSPACICSPNGDDTIAATDALICLSVSVGVEVPLNCPC